MTTVDRLKLEDNEIRTLIADIQSQLRELIHLGARSDAIPPGMQFKLDRLFARTERLLTTMRDHFHHEEDFMRDAAANPAVIGNDFHAHAADHARLLSLASELALHGAHFHAESYPLLNAAKLIHQLKSHGENFDRQLAH